VVALHGPHARLSFGAGQPMTENPSSSHRRCSRDKSVQAIKIPKVFRKLASPPGRPDDGPALLPYCSAIRGTHAGGLRPDAREKAAREMGHGDLFSAPLVGAAQSTRT
jgi:hypothetical protein